MEALYLFSKIKFLKFWPSGPDPDPDLDYPKSLDTNLDFKSKDPKHCFPLTYCFLGFNDSRERLLIKNFF
jgi:hypothetical protein